MTVSNESNLVPLEILYQPRLSLQYSGLCALEVFKDHKIFTSSTFLMET